MAADVPTTKDFEELLDLEEIDTDLYRGIHEPSSRYRRSLYGGQVGAQALRAAAFTVPEGRLPHSLHGYFLRPGRPDRRVVLRVARDRDGGSFSARHVVALQNGEVIFSMSASFHTGRPGPEWSQPRRPEAGPEDLEVDGWSASMERVMEVRPLPPTVPYSEQEFPVPARIWVRTKKALPDDPVLHACALTYASDLTTGFGDGIAPDVGRGGPSIDHAVWFHQPIRMDDWVLIETWPLKAGGGRGLYTGAVQDRTGQVGAALMQEMLFVSSDRSPYLPPR
jgi:acyl-CoA thioesterase-2